MLLMARNVFNGNIVQVYYISLFFSLSPVILHRFVGMDSVPMFHEIEILSLTSCNKIELALSINPMQTILCATATSNAMDMAVTFSRTPCK